MAGSNRADLWRRDFLSCAASAPNAEPDAGAKSFADAATAEANDSSIAVTFANSVADARHGYAHAVADSGDAAVSEILADAAHA